MLIAQLKNPLGRVSLLFRSIFVRSQDRIDDTDELIEFVPEWHVLRLRFADGKSRPCHRGMLVQSIIDVLTADLPKIDMETIPDMLADARGIAADVLGSVEGDEV